MNQGEKKTPNVVIKHLKTSGVKIVVTPQGVELHLPEGYNESKAIETIDKHRQWVERRVRELSELVELSRQLEIVERSIEELKKLVKSLAERATMELLGISNPCRVVVREMSKRWASLSSKGVLTINKLARYLPEPLLEYIVYHEICHLMERKHNSRFWSCVEKLTPNRGELEKMLHAYEVKMLMIREARARTTRVLRGPFFNA